MQLFGWQFEVVRPWWLLALGVLPVLPYYARWSLTHLSPERSRLSLGLRALLAVLLVLALCDVRITTPSPEPILVVAIDKSRSISEESEKASAAFVQEAAANTGKAPVRYVQFAAEPIPVEDPLATFAGNVESTNLARAIELACGLASPEYVPHVILLTDGNQTEGNAMRAARAARAAGVPISTAMLAPRLKPPIVPVVVRTTPPRVLVVKNENSAGDRLVAVLRERETAVDVGPPDRLPEAAGGFEPYRLVVLVNVPAASFSVGQMEGLKHYVHGRGGGLIVIGGDHSFTAGGYEKTALEEILPVESRVRPGADRPELAMVLVVDRSLSMREGGAIRLAQAAMRRAVNLLDSKDQIGLLAFDEASRWISPIRPCRDKAAILRQIDTLTAGGRTDMYPALEKAWLALAETFAETKHILVLTDGISHPGDFETLVKRIASSGITVSTVALGREASRPMLKRMARVGRGHFYACDNAAAIPQIFAVETVEVTRRGIHEKPFQLRLAADAPFLTGVDFRQAPALLGYVETQVRPDSRVTLATDGGDPLLAWWRYGRGISVAFTSDVQGRWATAWLRWPGFARFWLQLAQHALRPEDPPPKKKPEPELPLEIRAQAVNHALLRSIAEVTGGSYNPSPSAVLVATDRTAPRTRLSWPYLLGAAALLLVLDLTNRRFRV